MVGQLATIEFHPCLHGGLPKRGTGTATIEAKLAQQLAWVEQEPLYHVYLDLRKSYDHLDQEQCLAIMTAYAVGPKLLPLQTTFWEEAQRSVALGKVLGNLLVPLGASRRGVRYLASCLMFVMMQ
jgi:hypothetical protein